MVLLGFLHRCMIPDILPYDIQIQLQQFDPQCNYSVPSPQPSILTASLTATVTTTPSCEFYCIYQHYFIHVLALFSTSFSYRSCYHITAFTAEVHNLCYGGSLVCSICVPSDGCADYSLCLVQEVGQTQGMYVRARLTLRLKDLSHETKSWCYWHTVPIKTTLHGGTAG